MVESDDFAYHSNTLAQIFNNSDTEVDTENEQFVLKNVSDGSVATNFDGVEGGEYNFTFNVVDTTASDTASIQVNDVGEGSASFAESTYTQNRGDVAEITVNLSDAATGGTLIIGDEEDIGYEAHVNLTDENDDGEVTILFNTYEAGNGTTEVISAAGDEDTAELDTESGDLTTSSDLLDAGDYELQVSTGDAAATADSPDDLSVLIVEERSTDGLALWVTSDNTAGNVDDLSPRGRDY